MGEALYAPVAGSVVPVSSLAVAELAKCYENVFRAVNIAPETLHFVIMVECPRLLFPFARQIVADLVRNGGFPPLYIDPIDFIALYRQKAAENAANQGMAPGSPLTN